MILITGASGFVGKHLVAKLEPKNNIRCLVRNTTSKDGLEGCDLAYGDITDCESLLKATKGVGAVIHLVAALGAASYSENYKVHVEGAKNLIEACKLNDVRRIVVASSIATLAERKSDYGITKKIADELFLASGLDITILKPDFIYGKDGKGFRKLVDVIQKQR
ncbi:MAG: NAD(P)H-binding protein, partial [Candidatus Aenigmarchaeota archaeon]|nr:NAD(P)H-binding protein [Candidatus Aenigmarchaeota archaeon]